MRLVNVKTLQLHHFVDEREAPRYAILSHTWSDREVLCGDMEAPKKGQADSDHDWRNRSVSLWPWVKNPALDWKKVHLSCRQASADSIDYIWIDTCCIDKASSAELSEAINSMFRWYKKAAVCYAYLSDVLKPPDGVEGASRQPLEQSRWFRRGWTLQELIAPAKVVFYDCHWNFLGEKGDLAYRVCRITNIPLLILRQEQSLSDVSIAMRMSWAATRETTRIEDEAYCLLGIFDVNMPMLYGEGSKAFSRLQHEILRSSDDHTIFAWEGEGATLLAPNPRHFVKASTIAQVQNTLRSQYEVTKRGIRIALKLGDLDRWNDTALAIMDVVDLKLPEDFLALRLQIGSKNEDGVTEATLAGSHVLNFVNGFSTVWPHSTAKTELLILHPASASMSRSSVDETPVRLVVDADLLHLPIGILPIKQWDVRQGTSVLSHGIISDKEERRVIDIGNLDIDDGQLRSHLLVLFGYSHDKSTTPWSLRPMLRTMSCNASRLEQAINMALESDLGVNHPHARPQKKNADFGTLPIEVSVKCKRALRDGTSQESQIRIILQRASVGTNGNGWALIITHDKSDDSSALRARMHERQ